MTLPTLARAIAWFFAGFSLLNLLGLIFTPGFDANIWWIDLHWLAPLPARVLLLLTVLLPGAYALRPACSRRRRVATMTLLAVLVLVTVLNAIQYYGLLASGAIATHCPLPLSLLFALALGVPLAALWRNAPPPGGGRERARIAFLVACGLFLFPLGQVLLFGSTDYRRPADAIVVFGARTYANGTMSPVLRDRTLTGIALYRQGLAPRLFFSGGPGEGAVSEPESMRRAALAAGVPDTAIILDTAGMNSAATVANSAAAARTSGWRAVLAVSNWYHLPRIKLAGQQAGLTVYTVPAADSIIDGRLPYQVLREVAGLWAYYLHPFRRAALSAR